MNLQEKFLDEKFYVNGNCHSLLYELGRISKSSGAHFYLDGEWVVHHGMPPRWRVRKIGLHVLEAICDPYKLTIRAMQGKHSHIIVEQDNYLVGIYRHICAPGLGCYSADDIYVVYLVSVGYYLAPTL